MHTMWITIFLVFVIGVSFVAQVSANCREEGIKDVGIKGVEEQGLGALPEKPELTAPSHRVDTIVPASPDVDIKTNHSIHSVINIAGLPPVRSQGSQGSCTAWAVGYYHRTHLEWREKQWDANLTSHQCSPAFLYHHINGGYDTGGYISEAMEFICTMGCATYADIPYSASDNSSWPSSTQVYLNALQFRAYNYSWLSISDDAGLANLKQHIANGGTAVIAIKVYSNFDYISSYNNTYCVSEVNTNTYRGLHAVTVYGFDDEKQTADGVGAFRLVNSWGTSWGDSGHFWMSYEAMKNSTTCAGYGYFLVDRENYTPSLVTYVTVQHDARGEIMWNGITAGIGNITSPYFSLKILDFNWIQAYVGLSNYQRHAFPGCGIPVDLSDGIGYINRTAKNNLFVKLKDALAGTTGSIEFLNATDYTWGLSNVSGETPVVITDAGNYVYANVVLEERILFEHTPPAGVGLNEPIVIYVNVSSIDNITAIWTYYKPVNEDTWYAIAMSLTSGDAHNGTYSCTLPPQSIPGTLQYYFYAIDNTSYARASQNYSTIVVPSTSELSSVLLFIALMPAIFMAVPRM
ncbi:MAG: C1 family peptidase [Thermoplasmata archaeon]